MQINENIPYQQKNNQMNQNNNITYQQNNNQMNQNNIIVGQQNNAQMIQNQNINYQQNNNQMIQNNNMANEGNNNNNNFIINQINPYPNNNSINNLIPNNQNESNAPRNNLMSNQINGNNAMNNMNTQNMNYMENNKANLNDIGMNLNQNNNGMNSMNNINQNAQFNTGKNKNLNEQENSNNSNFENSPMNQNSNINNNQNRLINKKENENFIVDKDNHQNIEFTENHSTNDNNFPEEKDLLDEHKNEINNNEKKTEESFEDIYHYIKEDKIDIYFILANGEKKGVKIPSYLTRIELYFTAYYIIHKINKIEKNFSYKKLIFLYHNSKKVEYNDKKITEIKNKDEIKIEELSLFNFIYVCQPLEKDKKKHKYMNLIFFDPYNKEEKSYEFPEEITINDLMSLINFKNVDLKRAQISFQNNGEILNLNDKNLKEKKLKNVFANDRKINIEIKNNISLTKYPGKILEVSLVLKGKEKKHDNLKMYLGTLEPIIKFFGRLGKELDKNFPNHKEFKFFINDQQIDLKKDDERTFSSKGVNIMSDFKCSIIKEEKSFFKKFSFFK